MGFANVADRLADWMLPGMTARMSRPRFLTAMAVSAVVCDHLPDDTLAADGVSTPQIVFEWLVLEGFARAALRADMRQTPGIEKATIAKREGRGAGF